MTTAPTSTYRVQLTPGHGFAELARRAPYLARLGVGHAYLSPVLAAAPGSAHGYDVVDHGRVDDELGGLDGLRAAVAALRANGLGVLVDVVPNHMALPVPEHLNRVLWSVLRDGPGSPYAGWLDVEGDEPLVLPVLGRPVDECLDEGELVVDRVGGPDGEPVLRYRDHLLPLRTGTEDLPLPDLLAGQHYRLAYWRVGDEELNYRRFFEVDSLLGIRVEDDAVFDATHALLLDLVGGGVVDGLRVDHPDGLADPRAYLRLLAERTGGAYVVVEKILEEHEELPPDWACAGTTGYDALAVLTHVLVDGEGGELLAGAFADRTGAVEDWPEAAARARWEVLGRSLAAEVDRLARVVHAACYEDIRLRDHSLRGITEAVHATLAEMPVYRAYVVPGEPPTAEAVRVLEATVVAAAERVPHRRRDLELVRDLALGRLGRSPRKDEACVRFQQTTGPAMAKGVEDTACYRWFPLTALAEVGVRPDRYGLAVHEVHDWAARRLVSWPHALTATSTHDTKRSEDVRARVATLSEVAGEWLSALDGWRRTTGELGDGALEWLLWQTLVGAWPIDVDRLSAYLVKAAREARTSTSWTDPVTSFETVLEGYVRQVFAQADVLAGIERFVERVHPGFVANVLGQRALQLLLPGVPDVYQGCEQVSLRLVDPDNRVPPDAAVLDATLERGLAGIDDPAADLDAAKARLTALGLRLRRERPELATSPYTPVRVTGAGADHVVAFLRGDDVAVVTSRLVLRLAAQGGWEDTRVALPAGRWRDLLSGAKCVAGAGTCAIAQLLTAWPVALLVRDEA